MKLVLTLLSLLLPALSHSEELSPAEVLKMLSTDRVTLHYECKVQAEVPILFSGDAVLQKGAFRLKGNGLEVFCDSQVLVCVDWKAKEIYVERAASIEQYVKDNIGSVSDIKLSGVEKGTPLEDLSEFRYDWSGKDSSWVVTDLR